MIPTIKAEFIIPTDVRKYSKASVIGTTEPLIKFGTVVVTVERILVPKCSEAVVTNTAQYPMANPNATHKEQK